MKLTEVLNERWDTDKVKEMMDHSDDAFVWERAIQNMPRSELKRLATYMKKAGRMVPEDLQ